MSYYRPATVSEVLEFLESISYEQLQAHDLAAALVGQWELVGVYPTQ